MILLYHGVIPNDSPVERLCVGQALTQMAFERHVKWLVSRYRIVSLEEYLEDKRKEAPRYGGPIALTFDDGFNSTFQCVFPFLVESNLPAAIFVSTGHLDGGELLWFSYLKALCFENLYPEVHVNSRIFPLRTLKQRKQSWVSLCALAKSSGSLIKFCKKMAETYPLPLEIQALYGGMTNKQVQQAVESGIIELGAHTVTHPYLAQISEADQKREIEMSQCVLGELSGKPIRYFAYPGGDYTRVTAKLVQAARFDASFAVISNNIAPDPFYEIERIGIYSPSLLKLKLKTLGITHWARQFGLRVG